MFHIHACSHVSHTQLSLHACAQCDDIELTHRLKLFQDAVGTVLTKNKQVHEVVGWGRGGAQCLYAVDSGCGVGSVGMVDPWDTQIIPTS